MTCENGFHKIGILNNHERQRLLVALGIGTEILFCHPERSRRETKKIEVKSPPERPIKTNYHEIFKNCQAFTGLTNFLYNCFIKLPWQLWNTIF